MLLFNNTNKSRDPVFLLHLEIQELSNIPQSSGYCFVRWQLKEGTGTSLRHMKEEIYWELGQRQSSSQSKGSTDKVLVNHHRARWNYSLAPPLRVKLAIDKHRVLASKILALQVYFEYLENGVNEETGVSSPRSGTSSLGTQQSSASRKKSKGKLLLGSVSTDLAGYVNEEQIPLTNRLLLQKSKINSILTLKIRMQLIRGRFEDFNLHLGMNPTVSERIGFSEMFEDSISEFSPASVIPHVTQVSTPSVATTNNNLQAAHTPSLNSRKFVKNDGFLSITFNNALIEKLYQKTFQLAWDPRPSELCPRDCVEDIIEGGNGWARNELGLNLVDLKGLDTQESRDKDIYSYRSGRQPQSKSVANFRPSLGLKLQTMSSGYGQETPAHAPIEARNDWEQLSARQRKQLRDKSKRGYTQEKSKPSLYVSVIDEHSPLQMADDRSWRVNHILP